MICSSLYDPSEIKELEKHTEIIDISEDDALGGITNSVRVGNSIMCASNLSELKKTDELYESEAHKILTLEKICSNEGMEPIVFNISEFMKSGALLSCCCFHLNYVDQTKTLI
jgi:N-dimethylarginine dimethylaminohydrolase